MKGQILDFTIQNNSGLINGEDGKRYSFAGSEWKEQGVPARGMNVDFDVDKQGNAIGVYKALVSKSSVSNVLSNATQQRNESGQLSLVALFIETLTKRYANFSGRASKREYWGFALFHFLIVIAAEILMRIGMEISETLGGLLGLVYIVIVLGLLIPSIAVAIRRLHDINKPGWWYLLILLPIVGVIWLIVLLCQKSSPEENQWGTMPE